MPVDERRKSQPSEWRRGAGRERREWVFMYVPIAQADDYLRLGWIPRPYLDGTNHGLYSIYMEWLCECAVPLRRGDRKAIND